MNAVVLIGHGSIKNASGTAMIRTAARLRQQRIAPLAEAGFLNYSQPTLADAITKVIDAGATAVTVQPYFLIDGKYVREDLWAEVLRAAARHPQVTFRIGESFGAHRHMAAIVFDRVRAVDPALGTEGRPAALLLLAHGTPYPDANAPLERIAARVHARTDYCRAPVAYLDLNEPTIPAAIDQLVAEATQRIVAVPYFLQNGRHVRVDIPRLLDDAQRRHPQLEIRRAPYLGYDLRLVEVIRDRVREARVVENAGIGDQGSGTGEMATPFSQSPIPNPRPL